MPDSGVKISSLPSATAEDIQGTDVLAGVSDDATKKFSFTTILTWIKARLSKSDVGLDNVANVLQYSASNPPPTPTKSDIGLGNVDNVQQYSASNPPPYPVTTVNGQTGDVSITIPSPVSPSSASPAMDGTADAGSSSDYARGDHVHPTDTTRQATITATGVLVGDGSGGVSAKPVDSAPTDNSQNLISSAAVAGALGTLSDTVAIVIDGDQSALGAAVGQYVLLKNSTITGAADGLYTAATAIPANTDIDATYLTAVTAGGLNDLKAAIDEHIGNAYIKRLSLNRGTTNIYIPNSFHGFWGVTCGNQGGMEPLSPLNASASGGISIFKNYSSSINIDTSTKNRLVVSWSDGNFSVAYFIFIGAANTTEIAIVTQ